MLTKFARNRTPTGHGKQPFLLVRFASRTLNVGRRVITHRDVYGIPATLHGIVYEILVLGAHKRVRFDASAFRAHERGFDRIGQQRMTSAIVARVGVVGFVFGRGRIVYGSPIAFFSRLFGQMEQVDGIHARKELATHALILPT